MHVHQVANAFEVHCILLPFSSVLVPSSVGVGVTKWKYAALWPVYANNRVRGLALCTWQASNQHLAPKFRGETKRSVWWSVGLAVGTGRITLGGGLCCESRVFCPWRPDVGKLRVIQSRGGTSKCFNRDPQPVQGAISIFRKLGARCSLLATDPSIEVNQLQEYFLQPSQ